MFVISSELQHLLNEMFALLTMFVHERVCVISNVHAMLCFVLYFWIFARVIEYMSNILGTTPEIHTLIVLDKKYI